MKKFFAHFFSKKPLSEKVDILDKKSSLAERPTLQSIKDKKLPFDEEMQEIFELFISKQSFCLITYIFEIL